jgi:RNA polymerase sigma-70 factor (ECF subfamily)
MIDADLIKRCIKEDRRAQEVFYKACYNRYIGTAFRYASDKEQAVYYFNLGFVRILMNLKQYDLNNPFDYWAKRVLINTILNELKKEKREQEKVMVTDDLSVLNVRNNDAEYEEEIQSKFELVMEKAQLLPPMTKSVFNLYAVDGFKHNEIAELLGINENTSMWHYSEAKKKIRKMLDLNEQLV